VSQPGDQGWASLFVGAALPLAGEGSSRKSVVPAAPLPLGIAGEREVVDVLLAERQPRVAVREAVEAVLPPDWALVDLHDVWLGAPAAPASVSAADYRVAVTGPSRSALESAVCELLSAAELRRERRREKKTTQYDLRPLILGLAVRESGAAGLVLAMRLRHGPDAVGRPEEVVAALGEPPAPPLDAGMGVSAIVRERLILANDQG
jgi:radical SAM-linked protein